MAKKHKQNENTNAVRKSSGAVVFYIDGFDRVQIMLVRSTSGNSWCFPKGGIEDHLNSRTNAIKEVYEEAGVIGDLGETLLRYKYKKGGVRQHVTLYAMELAHELNEYPEAHMRSRIWVNAGDAYKYLSKELAQALDELYDLLVDQGRSVIYDVSPSPV
jgi:8-oxo-dGTP pyrophosphatase MutT (NUDIX family)